MKGIILTILIFTSCFGMVLIPEQSRIIAVVPLLFGMLTYKYSKKEGFAPYIYLFYFFITLGIFTCSHFRGQTPLQTIQTTIWVNLNGILSYFYVKNRNLDVIRLENFLLKLYLVFCACYIIQYLIFPFHIFATISNAGKGLRFRMVGQLILSLGFFMQLNKYLLTQKRIDLYKLVPGVLVFLLLGFRSMLAALVVSCLLIIHRAYGFSGRTVKILAVAGVLSIPIFMLPITQTVINNMIERQKTDNFDNEDYIRVIQYDYYTNYHFINNTEHILGSGIPKDGSAYGQSIRVSKEEYGSNMYGWVDWGFLGLSWIIGIPAVLCLIIISIKAIMTKVNSDGIYISVFYVFLLLMGLTTIEFFRVGGFIFHGIVLYILEKKSQEYNETLLLTDNKV